MFANESVNLLRIPNGMVSTRRRIFFTEGLQYHYGLKNRSSLILLKIVKSKKLIDFQYKIQFLKCEKKLITERFF
jgi:hypothetical protein